VDHVRTKVANDAAQTDKRGRIGDLDETTRGGIKTEARIVGLVPGSERARRTAEQPGIVPARTQPLAQSQEHEFRAAGGRSIVAY
jgi:hypothetical protein